MSVLNSRSYTLSILFLLFSISIFSQIKIKNVNAVKSVAPVIDGILLPDEWKAAEIATNFVQREPNEGEPATAKTEVKFLYDDKYLYIGVNCYDDSPELIANAFSNRDTYGWGDFIGIMLDTFHDHLNSYIFAVTAAGTQLDGKCFDDNRRSYSWDGIWWSETRIHESGWSAEMKIPFTTLQFDENKTEWGLNVFRNIARKREMSYWQFQNRDYQFRISTAGHLKNLNNLKNGVNLDFIPYATSSFTESRTSDFDMRNKNGVTGFDVKYGVTSNLNLVLTVNPDFAQIEADDERINLSNYPLYLSEKRPFFLEGNENFRTKGQNHSSNLFYSRRINNPAYGVKLSGKVGEWNIGFLHSLNEDDGGINSKISNEELASDFDNSAFYNILRINRDIFNNSQIGLIAMSKEYSGKYNRILGFDGQFAFWDNYKFIFEMSKSLNDGDNENSHSIYLRLNKSTDFFGFGLNYGEMGKDFVANELGFYNYNNYRKINGSVRIGPRLEEIGIRKLSIGLSGHLVNFEDVDFSDKASLTREMELWTMLSNMQYWAFRMSISKGKRFDRVDDFLYDRLRYSFFLDNNSSSDVYFRLTHNQGKYRKGYFWEYKSSATIKPFNKLKINLSYNRSLVKYNTIDTDEFVETMYEICRTKFYYYFTNKLDMRLIAQYNILSDRLNTYFLLGYRFSPGCALFIAYNEQFDSDTYSVDDIEYHPDFSSSQKVLQVKFSYLIQF
ncbi:MAG: DUF5916 domain-containing protein [Rhodothermaceae bacterium]